MSGVFLSSDPNLAYFIATKLQ
ncbi:hypothetical protein VCHENC02_0996, partial [Vibrio harveyi]